MTRITKRKRPLVSVGVAVIVLAAVGAVRGASYTILNLGSASGHADTFATSINTNGEIAINTYDIGTGTNPVLFTGGSSYTQVISLANKGDTLQQVNNSGLAVGYSFDSSSNSQAVYATASAPTLTKLATLTVGGSGSAFGVSPLGAFGTATIVGNSLAGNGEYQAVTWTGTNTVTRLTPTDTTDWNSTGPSEAYAINASGVITGQATVSGSTGNLDAFVTSTGGNFKNIAPTNSTQSLAESINSTGFVVGNWIDGSANQLAFLYTPTGGDLTLSNLGTPPGGDPDLSDAESINASDQIVGESLTNTGLEDAVIYNISGQVTDLNSLIAPSSGWTLVNAESINDAGDIVGTGTFDGQTDAFLLTPSASVPEPTSAILLSFGGIALLGRRRRFI